MGSESLGFRVLEFLGSKVVITGVISPLAWTISIAILLITLLTTTHEPPNEGVQVGFRGIWGS